jgi:hypothetical protein
MDPSKDLEKPTSKVTILNQKVPEYQLKQTFCKTNTPRVTEETVASGYRVHSCRHGCQRWERIPWIGRLERIELIIKAK